MRVTVEPTDLHGRTRDERPAELRFSPSDLPPDTRIDLSSLAVYPIDPASGAVSRRALPLRWYDDAIPYEFPECEQNINDTDGKHLRYVTYPRWGDFYNLNGKGRGGRLVWLHTQHGNQASAYEIHYRLVAEHASRSLLEQAALGRPPRDFVGDGSPRCAPHGDSSTDMIHSRVTVTDFNGDGLPDLMSAERGEPSSPIRTAERGRNPSFPPPSWCSPSKTNRSTSAGPRLRWRSIGTATARPISSAVASGIGFSFIAMCPTAFPLAGSRDLHSVPRYELKGFVEADGKADRAPHHSRARGGRCVQARLLPGARRARLEWRRTPRSARRRIHHGPRLLLRMRRHQPDGTPKLTFRDAIQADGQPLDVGWAAAPCAADFDGDGDFDLVVGCMLMSATGGDQNAGSKFLRYFENVGTRQVAAPRRTALSERGNVSQLGPGHAAGCRHQRRRPARSRRERVDERLHLRKHRHENAAEVSRPRQSAAERLGIGRPSHLRRAVRRCRS